VLGQIESVTKGGTTRTFTYATSNDFLTGVSNPETGQTIFGRDAVGNMISRRVGGSATTNYAYDGQNRLEFVDYPSGTDDVSFVYNKNHLVESITKGDTGRAYAYDQNDNLIDESLTIGTSAFDIHYGYTGLDYLDSITYPSGHVVPYAPDVLGRPTKVGSYVTTVGHHPNGQPSYLVYPNGRRMDISLNTRQWIDRITASGSILDLGYEYDAAGNVSRITDGIRSSASQTLTYDGTDRLLTASGVWGSGSMGYDAADNITRKEIGGRVLNYSYSSNRLSSVSGAKAYSYSYDNYGNITGNGSHQFDYDDAGDLRAVSGASTAVYEYDGNHLRVLRQKDGKSTYFVYTEDGQLLGEYDQTGIWKKEYGSS
jgi:YD repeat-containing protein